MNNLTQGQADLISFYQDKIKELKADIILYTKTRLGNQAIAKAQKDLEHYEGRLLMIKGRFGIIETHKAKQE